MTDSRRPDSGNPFQPPDGGPTAELLRAWQRGQSPELEAFLAGLPNLSPGELAALVRVDLDQRRRRQEPRRAEDYLTRFPTLATDAESAIDVIYAEYLAREQSGERPDIDEFRRRFPAFGDVLAEQIGLHCALQMLDDDARDETNQSAAAFDTASQPLDDSPFDASFEIIEEIGRGGMGVVYKARQPALNRFVALKMVRAVDASNEELLTRFRSEARAVASLRHPHIVQVYDFGEHDGLPYLAMELIECGTLAERLDGTPWLPRAAAELLVKLAGGVQCAHDRQIIHRDLKPANVLIASADEGGLDVKITDFGLAKLFHDEGSANTKSVAFLGTPSYMAPEQASGGARGVGPATDVYALGAILYELLTGRPPFRGASPLETLQQLLATEPVSVNRLAPGVPRDLATICEKCLRTEIDRRYASAAELRADLQRYLAGMPVQARRLGGVERTWRWCRRNPTWTVALASVALLLISVAAVSLWYSSRLSRELVKTQQAERSERIANHLAQQRLFDAYMAEVAARNGSRQVGQRFAALDSIEAAAALIDTLGQQDAQQVDRTFQLRNAVLCSVALPDMRILRTLGTLPESKDQCDLSVATDRYVVATGDGTLLGYRLADGQHLWTAEHSAPGVRPVLSPDGRFVAATGDAGTKVWRVDRTHPERVWETAHAQFFTFAPDGQHAAYSLPTEGMRLVDVETGNIVRAIGNGPARSPFAFHAASRTVAVCVPENTQVISWETGEIELELPTAETLQQRIAWHPSGEYLAVWTSAPEITLWHVKSRSKAIVLPAFGIPSQLCFNDDGSMLASHSLWDQRLLVWDISSAHRLLEVKGFSSLACDTASDGRILYLGDGGSDATLTELAPGASRSLAQSLHAPLGNWYKLAVSPEGRILAASSERGLELWDLLTTQRLAVWPAGTCAADFDDAGFLIVGCASGIYRWPRSVEATAEPTADGATSAAGPTSVRFGPPERLVGPIVPHSLATNPSGEAMVFEDAIGWGVMHPDRAAAMVRLKTTLNPRKGAISSDNRYAAIANWDRGGAEVWDALRGTHLADLGLGRCGVVQFSPDGRLLAATPDGVTLWRCGDWQRVRQLQAQGTTPTGLGIAFSPDSRVLAVGQPNGILRLVDPSTGNDWARLTHSDMSVASVIAFSPDQRYLVTSSLGERSPTQIWDMRVLRSSLERYRLDWPAEVLATAASPSPVTGRLEVVLDDGGLLDRLDDESRRSAAIRQRQSSDESRKRTAQASLPAKTAE